MINIRAVARKLMEQTLKVHVDARGMGAMKLQRAEREGRRFVYFRSAFS